MRQKFIKHKTALIVTAAVITLALFLLWQNTALTVSRHTYTSSKIPQAFDGFCIVHISDLHNASFGKEQERLLRMIAQQQPDAIMITGDLVDSRRYDLLPAMQFVQGAVTIAPTYYVSGNHELSSGHWEAIKRMAKTAGAEVLEDTFTSVSRGGERIQIIGLGNGTALGESSTANNPALGKMAAVTDQNAFRLLLAHHPERFSSYCESGMDMVFSGHAHGGQIRLPFIGGLYAPNQGFFPTYTSGAYTDKGTTMFVSRGLGNSLFPFRIWNRPEVLTVTLRHEADTAA
ncbi:MAG: metallophosphoesterase [Eubacteriales bacterium]|nr:metallophosphoesterase [Eubacteriales bacterium]